MIITPGCPGYMKPAARGEIKRKATEKFHLINSQKLLCRSSSTKSVHGHQCIALPFIREQRVSELSQCPRSRESLTFLFQFHPSIYGSALCSLARFAVNKQAGKRQPASDSLHSLLPVVLCCLLVFHCALPTLPCRAYYCLH